MDTETHVFTPSSAYLSKMWTFMTVIAVLAMVSAFGLAWLIEKDDGPGAASTLIVVFLVLDAAWYLPGLVLAAPYYRSLRYEILDDEVIVHVGIWTKSVKHVPYRTVTNIKINRDILDRWFFGLGSLNVQTAGMSGKTGAEESLVGLPNVQEVYEIVSARLRRYRKAMSPTAGVEEGDAGDGTLAAILNEVQTIRRSLEK